MAPAMQPEHPGFKSFFSRLKRESRNAGNTNCAVKIDYLRAKGAVMHVKLERVPALNFVIHQQMKKVAKKIRDERGWFQLTTEDFHPPKEGETAGSHEFHFGIDDASVAPIAAAFKTVFGRKAEVLDEDGRIVTLKYSSGS